MGGLDDVTPTLIVFVVAVVAGYLAYRRAGGELMDDDTIFRRTWYSRGSWPKTVAVGAGLAVFVIGEMILLVWPN